MRNILLAAFAMIIPSLFIKTPALAAHQEVQNCGSHTQTQPVGNDANGNPIYGNVTVNDNCAVWVPDYHDYRAALAIDDTGMAYGAYASKVGLIGNLSNNVGNNAVKECQKANPNGKCHVVANVSGGSIALAWDKVRGGLFWATQNDNNVGLYDLTPEQEALKKCGTADCKVIFWVTAPKGTTAESAPISQHEWLGGNASQSNVHLYGAFTTVGDNEHYAYVTGMKTPEDARKITMYDCQNSSLKNKKCEFVTDFVDTCASIAWSVGTNEPEYFVQTAPTPEKAEEKVDTLCRSKYANCRVDKGMCSGVMYGQTPKTFEDFMAEDRAKK